MSIEKLGYSNQGDSGRPGSGYVKFLAIVSTTKTGYQLDVRHVWGSNQGYLEEHGRIERKYRARSIDELMRVGIAEVRQEDDEVFDGAAKSKLVAAIREACFEAQDAEPIREPEPLPIVQA